MNRRLLVKNDVTISHTFYGQDEETPTDVTGSAKIKIRRHDDSGVAEDNISTNSGSPGRYEFKLFGNFHCQDLEYLKIVWSGRINQHQIEDTEYVKIVGGRYFPLIALRNSKGLSNTTKYTNEELKSARDIAEDFIESFTEHSFVPAYRREVYDGDNNDFILLQKVPARRILDLKINGVSQNIDGWTITPQGRIKTTGSRFTSRIPQGNNIAIKYEWGESQPELDLSHAAIALARYILINSESSIPDRARLMQTEFAMFHLDTASEDNPTGLPQVDAVLTRYRKEQPGSIIG